MSYHSTLSSHSARKPLAKSGKSLLFVAGALLLSSSACSVQSPSSATKAGPVAIGSDRQLTIEGPIHDLIYNRDENLYDIEKESLSAPYLPVRVTYGQQVINGSVRLRGGVRFCGFFPQLKLKLPKTNMILGQKEFKIITPGAYAIDPNIAIHAPNCDDQFYDNGAASLGQRENTTYDLAGKVLDYHLEGVHMNVRYIDAQHNLDINDTAYLLEDKDHAAKRYNMKAIDLGGAIGRISWRAESEDMIDGFTAEKIYIYRNDQYCRLQTANPSWTQAEITANLDGYATLEANGTFGEFVMQATNELAVSKEKLKRDQLALLVTFDENSLAQTALFNTLIGNSDWNVLGMTTHSKGIWNVELLKNDQNQIFAVPYDFNETRWAKGYDINKVTVAQFKANLDAIVTAMNQNFDGYLTAALRSQALILSTRLDAQKDEAKFAELYQDRIENFVIALKEFSEAR